MHDLDIMKKILKNISEVGDLTAANKMNAINQKGVVDAQSNRVMSGQRNIALRASPTASLTQPVDGTPADEQSSELDPGIAASQAAAGGPTPPTQVASNMAEPTQVGVAANAAGTNPNSPAMAGRAGIRQRTMAGNDGDWTNKFLSELEEIARDVVETHPHSPRASVPIPPKTPQSDLGRDLNTGIDQFKKGLGGVSNFMKGRDWNKDAEDLGKFGKDFMGRLQGMGKSFRKGFGSPTKRSTRPTRPIRPR